MSRRPFLGILLAIAAWAMSPVYASNAATIAVTTTTDELNGDGDCSLREAVRAANTAVIERERPDVVVQEMVERTLVDDLPPDPPEVTQVSSSPPNHSRPPRPSRAP